ncbi:hypothetical protein D9611_010926 [Ephemerocybe angulata]|uniref:Uncharacterized protein n=1 Tax=Ephemerocybe angulata TaxID=980116 RepID=A0A8H5C531_9AGAR|nr:hypothetical protein D9611_010926 [Tulosesus angulatus]
MEKHVYRCEDSSLSSGGTIGADSLGPFRRRRRCEGLGPILDPWSWRLMKGYPLAAVASCPSRPRRRRRPRSLRVAWSFVVWKALQCVYRTVCAAESSNASLGLLVQV